MTIAKARGVVVLGIASLLLGGQHVWPATSSIAAGFDHGMALKSDGTVWTWGDDSFGELGSGRQLLFASPNPVAGVARVVAASPGSRLGESSYVAVLLSDSTVWAWGANDYGQLGDGTTTARSIAAPVAGLGAVRSISSGGAFTLAVRDDGSVWAWGYNGTRQLGDGTPGPSRATPAPVSGLTGVIAVAAGLSHGLALKGDGTVWAWGDNSRGQLGDASTTTRPTPVQVSGLAGVTAISAGFDFSVAVRGDGTVWAWGYNLAGQLGDGSTINRSTPVAVTGLDGVTAISAGNAHAVAVKADGSVWGWGSNNVGQLGNGLFDRVSPLVRASGLAGVASVSAGGDHSVAIKSDGTMMAWGYNEFGALGDGSTVTRGTPFPVAGLTGVKAASAGFRFTVAVLNEGTVSAWGSNTNGQLGDSAQASRYVPSALAGLADVVAISGGRDYGMALKSNGTVWGWGSNSGGKLGDGTFVDRSTPVAASGLTGVVSVVAGTFHSLAQKADGSVWAWGSNRGTFGNGAIGVAPVPTPAPGLNGATALAAGQNHTIALRGDGTVWATGLNTYGQLGDGTTVDRTTPVQVSRLSGAIAIAAGSNQSFAVRADGSVWAWGQNVLGVLGDGSTTDRSSPVQVTGLTGVLAVSAGLNHAVALKSDGSVWTWGYNSDGQVPGAPLRAIQSIPIRAAAIPSMASVSAGGSFTLALGRDGVAWSWGANSRGQLGDGTSAVRISPTVIHREEGAGTIETEDWFLDLDPATHGAIPPDKVPVFLAKASGVVTSNVSAEIQFRAQDVGRPYYVFAYAPTSVVKASAIAKEDPACLLAQLTSSGLRQVSASALQVAGSVTTAQGQAVTVLSNLSGSPIGGATFCIGSGPTNAQAVERGNSHCVTTVPGPSICLPPTSAVSANLPGALSGLWWNANESGWGIHFTQRSSNIFAAWYTYDTAGSPKWYVASNCVGAVASSGTCSGTLYEVSGPTFFGTTFNPSLVNVVNAGSLQVSFANASSASMSYTVAGQSRTVAIVRQPLGGGTIPGVDYTDLWWNPSESGWGMAMAQQGTNIFLAWYVYDGAGRPTWYVASNCTVSGAGCSGTLYRTTGPPFGPTFNSSAVQAFAVGSATLTFSDANSGTLSYTVNGVSGSKAITRQLF